MSQAVVICKIAWYKGAGGQVHGRQQSSWHRHLEYIATRPEADRGDADALRVGDDDYALDRAAMHIRYAAGRPGSTGLFGPEGQADWREVARELERRDLPTWRVIVSMREEDAAGWGMIGREKWEAAIREAVQDAAKAMHLDPDHVQWVAAYHAKPGQPHAHLIVWESPHVNARRRGFLEEGERRGVWRSFTRELFREERDRLAAEKSTLRDEVLTLAKGDTGKAVALAREFRAGVETARLEVQALDPPAAGIPPIPRDEVMAEFARRLDALAVVMPQRGRAALAYMPEPVKAQAREVAGWLLDQHGFRAEAEKYEAIARRFAEHATMKPEAHAEAARKAREDLRDRVAQVVLRAAIQVKREHGALEAHGLDARALAGAKAGVSRMVGRAGLNAIFTAIQRERLRAEAAYLLAQRREMEKRTRRRNEEERAAGRER